LTGKDFGKWIVKQTIPFEIAFATHVGQCLSCLFLYCQNCCEPRGSQRRLASCELLSFRQREEWIWFFWFELEWRFGQFWKVSGIQFQKSFQPWKWNFVFSYIHENVIFPIIQFRFVILILGWNLLKFNFWMLHPIFCYINYQERTKLLRTNENLPRGQGKRHNRL